MAITTGNSAPIADAGDDRTVALGPRVQLDGSRSSDPDGDPLTFAWTLAARPAASTAVLDDPSTVRPVLVADVPGSYVVQLVVHDGLASSALTARPRSRCSATPSIAGFTIPLCSRIRRSRRPGRCRSSPRSAPRSRVRRDTRD